MLVHQFKDPESSTFTYIIAKGPNSEAIIIDPVLERTDEYFEFLGKNNLRLMKAVDTHIHADHITGLGKLRATVRCMTLVGKECVTDVVSRRFGAGDLICVDGVCLKAIYTPGHTDDSYSFYMEGMVFTGDTLFIRGNGRTDFQNGSAEALYKSITEKLFSLPDSTIVMPGHDYKGENLSTIGKEKVENPRVHNKSLKQFVDIMNNLNLPHPKLMDIAVPANRQFGKDINDKFEPSLVLSVREAQEKVGRAVFVDLRDEDEIEMTGIIDEAVIIPYKTVESEIGEGGKLKSVLDQGKDVVFYCAHGERSALALDILVDKGFSRVFHLNGGIAEWLNTLGEIKK